ncbi:hypothetical protein ZWY2020_039037 [Hordeum vulgare]|nr:hypothetical protein ZWY2020_039037 [Hordeum vulgare]
MNNIIQTNHRPIAYEFLLLLLLLVLLCARARAASRVPDASLSVGARGAHTAVASTVCSGVSRSWLFPTMGVYLKRENSGSWNSGLEKEQILVHYSAHLQMP